MTSAQRSRFRLANGLILKNPTGSPHIHGRLLDSPVGQQRKRDPASNGSRAGVEIKLNWEKHNRRHKKHNKNRWAGVDSEFYLFSDPAGFLSTVVLERCGTSSEVFGKICWTVGAAQLYAGSCSRVNPNKNGIKMTKTWTLLTMRSHFNATLTWI